MVVNWLRVGEMEDTYTHFGDRNDRTCFLNVLFILFYLFIFGCVGSLLLRTSFLLVVASRGRSSLRCAGFSLQWLLLLRSTDSRRAGFSSCGTWAQ